MGEFELIRSLFGPVADATAQDGVILGPGDDCAIQRIPENQDLVFSVDTLVEGVHFPYRYDPLLLGWRSLAVAVSDLAAMGAAPVCFTLAVTLPDADECWLTRFTSGLSEAAQSFGIALAGGDVTRGPLTLTLQVHGTVPRGQAIRRSGAQAGDLVCVTGSLGAAAAALALLDVAHPTQEATELLEHYHRPQPRLSVGQSLVGLATAAIDISDGLVADLGHILVASGVGARLELACLPLAADTGAPLNVRTERALYGGDDYELCFTLPADRHGALPGELQDQVTVVGEITGEREYRLVDAHGVEKPAPSASGYDHFSDNTKDVP